MSNSGSKPRISIGMPLYNRENYVAASIDAHLCQTYDDFELIITDNASTDRGPEICRAAATAWESRSGVRREGSPRKVLSES